MISIDTTEAFRLLDRLPADIQNRIIPRLAEAAADNATEIRAAASRVSRLAALAGRSVTSGRTGSTPYILGGGPGRLPSGRGTFGDIFFGAEFGGQGRPTTQQFPPYRAEGYWFFPTLNANNEQLGAELADVLDDLDGW